MSLPVIHSSFDSGDLNADPTQGLYMEHLSIDEEWIGDDSVPLQTAGVFARPRRRLRLIVTYTGQIQPLHAAEDPLASVREIITAFEATFIPSNNGDLVELLEDGSSRTLAVRPRGTIERGPVPEFVPAVIVFTSYEAADWQLTPGGS